MSNRALVMAVFLAFTASINASTITINGMVSNYLATYLPNSTIASASYSSQTVGKSSYILMQLSTGANQYMVINTTKGISLMQNATNISVALRSFLISKYYPNATTLNSLNTTMQSFVQYSQPALNSCLQVTGLNIYACTLQNVCQSCQAVPNCKTVLNKVGGPNTPFGLGIINFSMQYNQLNNSYSSYFSLLKSMNASNAGNNLAIMGTLLTNISRLSANMYKNPIFPLPLNFSPSLFNTCSSYGSPNSQPWYCVSIGYCEYVNFNNTQLSTLMTKLAQLNSLPLSSNNILSVSVNSSTLAFSFVNPVLSKQRGMQLSTVLAVILPRYNKTVQGSNTLLSHVNNATLSTALLGLETTYASILGLGINQNITLANVALNSRLNNVSKIYTALLAVYGPVYGMAANNTNLLLVQQLSYRNAPASLVQLSSKEQMINAQLNGRITAGNISSITLALGAIGSQASPIIQPTTIGAVVKSIDEPFIVSLLAGSNASVPSKLSTAPLYAAILSLIIGAAAITSFYVTVPRRLERAHRLKRNRRTRRAWNSLYVALAVLVALYAYVTYANAVDGNSFLPLNQFVGIVRGSNQVFIALNATRSSNLSITACAASLQNNLRNMSKNVQVIVVANYSCVSSTNSSLTGTRCFDSILASTVPMIFMGQSANTSISYNGMYGNLLYANGAFIAGASCQLSTLFNGR